jgi:hypothetical protein
LRRLPAKLDQIDASSRLSWASVGGAPVLAGMQYSVSHDPLQALEVQQRYMMETSTIYFPVTCPCCGQEYVMASNRNMIVAALTSKQRLTLCAICAHHRVMWVANEIERGQIREYAETLHFLESGESHPRRYA